MNKIYFNHNLFSYLVIQEITKKSLTKRDSAVLSHISWKYPTTSTKIRKFYNGFCVERINNSGLQFSSVTQSYLTLCDPHGQQHVRPPCPSPTPGVYSHSHPLNWWYHSTISFSVIPFSSCLQSFPASGFFPVSQFFTSSGQSIEVSASASVLPMNIQD